MLIKFYNINVNFCNNFKKNPKVFEKCADNINTRNRVKDMANSFNLNTFLQEYKTYGDRKYTSFENGQAAMEQREIKKAEEAVNASAFLSLTLREKLNELGVGDKVMQQLGEIALKPVTDIVNSINDYFDKYEVVFDQEAYKSQLQSDAKQMFFSRQALAEDAASRIPYGQNFVATF